MAQSEAQPELRTARSGGIPRGIAADGPAILSYGFRPFFLGAGVFALIAMVLWIGALTAGWEIGGDTYGALYWHAHEMIFGYATAALAGFMLTAIPNWTGRFPLSGPPLLGLVLLWLAGRIGMLDPDAFGLYPAIVADTIFLPTLAIVAGREIVAGRNWKNLKILVALLVLGGVNIAFHLLVLTGGDAQYAFRAAVSALVALIGLVGGRIIPSFTRNWLAKAGATMLPHPADGLDVVAMTALIAALACWTVRPDGIAAAALAVIAAVLQGWRLGRWRGLAVIEEPLLLVLHLAYGFIPLGMAAIAAAALGWMSPPSALHLLTVGAIGNTTLAVMARATRGHTGRPLRASLPSTLAFLALLVAGVIRPFAEAIPSLYHPLLAVSGGAWILGFALFCAEYAPMLLRRKPAALRAD